MRLGTYTIVRVASWESFIGIQLVLIGNHNGVDLADEFVEEDEISYYVTWGKLGHFVSWYDHLLIGWSVHSYIEGVGIGF